VENVSGSVDAEIRKVEAASGEISAGRPQFPHFSAPAEQHRLQVIEANRPYLSIEEKAGDD
jgi:hypothetical protein